MSNRTMPGTTHRNGLPEPRLYAYRGTGKDTLTGHLTPHELEAGSLRDAAPSAYEAERDELLLRMCPPCWDDNCGACQGGTCKCACRDEPEPDPRCADCGYLVRGINHKIVCGSTR